MCPICMGAVAIALAGTGSAGGMAGLVVAQLRRRRRRDARPAAEIDKQPGRREANHEQRIR